MHSQENEPRPARRHVNVSAVAALRATRRVSRGHLQVGTTQFIKLLTYRKPKAFRLLHPAVLVAAAGPSRVRDEEVKRTAAGAPGRAA